MNLVPHLVVQDGEAAIAFYQRAFGASLEMKRPADDGRRVMFAQLKIGNSLLNLNDDFPEFGACGSTPPPRLGGTSVTLHLEVADPDSAWARATQAGATVSMPLEDQFWGMRYGQLTDPFGHLWSIGGPTRK